MCLNRLGDDMKVMSCNEIHMKKLMSVSYGMTLHLEAVRNL